MEDVDAANVKMFEVRDAATTMVVIALKPNPRTEAERWGWAHAGYGTDFATQHQYVLLAPLVEGGTLVYDPLTHRGAPHVRTLPTAHRYIIEHWEYLRSGDVVDVEFILGETTQAKTPDREYKPPTPG